jgi:hypothetical protein
MLLWSTRIYHKDRSFEVTGETSYRPRHTRPHGASISREDHVTRPYGQHRISSTYLYTADIVYSLTDFNTNRLGLAPCLKFRTHSRRFLISSFVAVHMVDENPGQFELNSFSNLIRNSPTTRLPKSDRGVPSSPIHLQHRTTAIPTLKLFPSQSLTNTSFP